MRNPQFDPRVRGDESSRGIAERVARWLGEGTASEKVVASAVVARPGAVRGDAGVDGDPKRTVAALGEVIAWSSLRLKPEKAEQLLKRPPVKFLLDVLAALDAAAPEGWLGKNKMPAQPAAAPEARKAYFDEVLALVKPLPVLKALPKLAATSESILAGSGAQATNAFLQSVAVAVRGRNAGE